MQVFRVKIRIIFWKEFAIRDAFKSYKSRLMVNMNSIFIIFVLWQGCIMIILKLIVLGNECLRFIFKSGALD